MSSFRSFAFAVSLSFGAMMAVPTAGSTVAAAELPPHHERSAVAPAAPHARSALSTGSSGLAPNRVDGLALLPEAPPLPGSTDLAVCLTSSRVWGLASASQVVTITVNGVQAGANRADGQGFFWSTLYAPTGQRAPLQANDVVTIYRGASSSGTRLRAITGEVLPLADIVSGSIGSVAAPISVTVYVPWGEPGTTTLSRTVTTDAAGRFTANFGGLFDLTSEDEASISYVLNGIEVHRHVYARQSLMVRPAFKLARGRATPGMPVTVTLYLPDGVTVKESVSAMARASDGLYAANFGVDLLAGEIVAARLSSGVVMSRVVDVLTEQVDPANNRITGQAKPGATVVGVADDLTALGWRTRTVMATVSAGGVYTLNFSGIVDIIPGQWVGVFVPDAQGDDLNLWRFAPNLVVDQATDEVNGGGDFVFGVAEGQPVTMTLYQPASGATRQFNGSLNVWGQYGFSPQDGSWPNIVPGDVVTVETGDWAGVVQVQPMTITLNTSLDRITGSIVPPASRVDVWGRQSWNGWHYPVAGEINTLATVDGATFTATLSGFDLRNGSDMDIRRRTTDDYVDQSSREMSWVEVNPSNNGLEALLGIPNTAYTATLYSAGGSPKAQLTGVASPPQGRTNWRDFWSAGAVMEPGDRVQVRAANGFSQTVVIPDIGILPDELADRITGRAPANTLVFVEVGNQAEGFVPVNASGAFAVVVDQLANVWGNGDLQWGAWISLMTYDQAGNRVRKEYRWPNIIANDQMSTYGQGGEDAVWGNNAIPGNAILITVTSPVSGVIATGQTSTGTCDWCDATGYRLALPAGTIVAGTRVTVNFGSGLLDGMQAVAITASPDPQVTHLVTGTAPANGTLSANVNWDGGWSQIDNVLVDATGIYTLDFAVDGQPSHLIAYGDNFNIHFQQERGHQTQYSFWIPRPDVGVWTWDTGGSATPGGVVVYQIEYANDGSGVAETTIITAALPALTTYAGDTSGVAPAVGANGVITWNMGLLVPGARERFAVTLNVDPSASVGSSLGQSCVRISSASPGDPNSGNDSACSGEVGVQSSAVDVAANTWPGPSDPAPGQHMDYLLQPCNNRSGAAGPVWLTATLPASTTVVSWREDNWQGLWQEVSRAGGELVLRAPGLPGSMCQDVRLTVQVDAGAAIGTRLTNQVTIATAGDEDSGNDVSTNRDAIVSPARVDLGVERWMNAGQLVPGGQVDEHMSFRNNGNTAVRAWITETLPPGTSYQPGSSRWQDGGPAFEPALVAGQLVVWDLGELGVNQGTGLDFRMDIGSGVTPGTVLTNTAVIASAYTDNYPQDNRAVLTDVVRAHGPNLRVSKSSQWQGGNNERLYYEISIRNVGDATASGVTVTDTYPAGTSVQGGSVGGDSWLPDLNWSGDPGARKLVYTMDRLEAGWGARLWFTVQLDNPGERVRWYTNTLAIGPLAGDVYPNDNAHVNVAFSGGELDRIELSVDQPGGSMWGHGQPDVPMTVTLAHTTTRYTGWIDGGGNWRLNGVDAIAPGERLTVTAGAGRLPVIITAPQPFTAQADSRTNRVTGRLGNTAGKSVWVTGQWTGESHQPATDASGYYTATFTDVPRTGRGDVRYEAEINHALVDFHRAFQTPDLAITVNPSHDWVEGVYESGHRVWITLTGATGNLKATASGTTGSLPWWQDQTGFSTNENAPWAGQQPDIEVGDWMYGALDNGYTTSVHVGEITGVVDADADTLAGVVNAPWFTQTLNAQCWVDGDGNTNRDFTVSPNGGAYECDFAPFDVNPGHTLSMQYQEPDGDWVRAVFNAPRPQLEMSLSADGSPGVGGTFAFRMQYRNAGDGDAADTLVTATLSGATYLSDSSAFPHTGTGAPGDPIAWSLGNLPPGDWAEFTLFVRVTAGQGENVENRVVMGTSNPYNQGWPDQTWAGTAQPNDTRLSVGQGAWTGDPAPGYAFVYNVSACNNGSTGSTQMTLTDTLPVSTTLTSWWSDDFGWTQVLSAPHQLVLTMPSLSGGRCAQVYVKVTLAADAWAGMTLQNDAEVYAANDVSTGDDASLWSHQVGEPHRNLNISQSFNRGRLTPGGEVHYDAHYQNTGNLPITRAIRITATLPAGTSFREALANKTGLGVTPIVTAPGYVVWQFPPLDNGAWADFEIVLDIAANAVPGTALTHTLAISPQPNEDSYDDNIAVWAEAVYPHGPNLRMRKTGRWNDWGENTRQAWYDLRIDNIGDTVAPNVVFTDTYPALMSLAGGAWSNWCCGRQWNWWDDPAGHRITGTFDALNPGESAQMQFNTQVPGGGPLPFGQRYTNTAQVMRLAGETNVADNTASLVLKTGPDLFVSKTLVGGDLRPGSLVTFLVRFGNDHEGWMWWWNLQGNAVLTDTLPTGLTFVDARQHWCGPGNPDWCERYPEREVGQRIGFDLWPMKTGEWNELLVTARLSSTVARGAVLTNVVQIVSSQPAVDIEPDYGNNVSAYRLTVPAIIVSITTSLTDTVPNWTVSFTASVVANGLPVSPYAWSFGDGVTAGGATATHAFTRTGVFTVSVVVGDGAGYVVTATRRMTVTSGTQMALAPGVSRAMTYTHANGNAVTVLAPAGAVTEPVDVRYTPVATTSGAPAGGFSFAGLAFNLTAYRGSGPLGTYQFAAPITLTLSYTTTALGGRNPATLRLTTWNGSAWVEAACGAYQRNLAQRWIRVPVCHLSQFALFGQFRTYVPVVRRGG